MARVLNPSKRFASCDVNCKDEAIPPDDYDLVTQAARDRRCFGALYDRYLTVVYRYCYLRLGSKEAAEDATSSVFTRAMIAIGSCDAERFRPWLFAIARNVVTDVYRSRQGVEPLEVALDLSDPRPGPLEFALEGDDERSVRSLLDRLTLEQREIVELRLAGLSGVEIAAALGMNPGAVRAAQFRAFSRLRALLGDGEKDPGAHS